MAVSTVDEVKEYVAIQAKMNQSLRIRLRLVVRKFELLERFFEQKNIDLRTFLQKYEELYNKEESILKSYRKGIDIGKKILQDCYKKSRQSATGKNMRGMIKETIKILKKFDKRLTQYEKRLLHESRMLHRDSWEENPQEQLTYLSKVNDMFKKEVVADLLLLNQLEQDVLNIEGIRKRLQAQAEELKDISKVYAPLWAAVMGGAVIGPQLIAVLTEVRTPSIFVTFSIVVFGLLGMCRGWMSLITKQGHLEELEHFITTDVIKKLKFKTT